MTTSAEHTNSPTDPDTMLDTTLPFPYQSDQQYADWAESQSSSEYRFDNDDYCQSFLAHADAEGNVSESVLEQIFDEHGSDLADFTESLQHDQSMFNGVLILQWLGY